MKAFLNKAGTETGSLFFFIAIVSLWSYVSAKRRSPVGYTALASLILFFLWRFVIQPFRAGLKNDVTTELNLKDLRDYRATYRTNKAEWYPTEQRLEEALSRWK